MADSPLSSPDSQVLVLQEPSENFPLESDEIEVLSEARELLKDGYPGHALINLWNAALRNVRRRVEAYGIDLFLPTVSDKPGRSRYDKTGDTLAERWEGVDTLLLLDGARKLGLINKKSKKIIKTINWMRNHASPAHRKPEQVEKADVMSFALLLQNNLFNQPLPEPGHTVDAIFDPVRSESLSSDQLETLKEQIRSFSNEELRTCFGFLLEQLTSEKPIPSENAHELLPVAWEHSTEDLKSTAGMRFHQAQMSDERNVPKINKLLDLLVKVDGVRYIPESSRADLYRKASERLSEAKDSSYGWDDEESAARTLSQFGTHVPRIAFTQVYREILAVWCGNYWGRSDAHEHLGKFIDDLQRDDIRRVIGLFGDDERVQHELHYEKPKSRAIDLIQRLKDNLTIATHKEEAEKAIEIVSSL